MEGRKSVKVEKERNIYSKSFIYDISDIYSETFIYDISYIIRQLIL